MNRERLKTLRDHLAGLSDERLDMRSVGLSGENLTAWSNKAPVALLGECGTAACIAGWSNYLFAPTVEGANCAEAERDLGLNEWQGSALFTPPGFNEAGLYTRADAIAAIDSMLASPDDDALPIWPERAA